MDKRQVALRLVGVGFFIGGSIVLGVLGGMWLDGKLGSAPVFLIIGLILGLVVAFYGVYQMIRPLLNNKRNGKGDDG